MHLGQKLGHAGLVEHAGEPADAPTTISSGAQLRPASAEGCQRPANSTPKVMAMTASISGLLMPI